MNTDGEEINRHATVVSEKDFCYIMNTDKEEPIMDAHEISMQGAVMSGLEDVNSCQLYVALTRGKYHENLCVQVHNSLYQGKLFGNDQTFTKMLSKNY